MSLMSTLAFRFLTVALATASLGCFSMLAEEGTQDWGLYKVDTPLPQEVWQPPDGQVVLRLAEPSGGGEIFVTYNAGVIEAAVSEAVREAMRREEDPAAPIPYRQTPHASVFDVDGQGDHVVLNFVLPSTPERRRHEGFMPATVTKRPPQAIRDGDVKGEPLAPYAASAATGGSPFLPIRHPPSMPRVPPYPVEAALFYPVTETRRDLVGSVARHSTRAAAVVADVATSPVQVFFWLAVARAYEEGQN